jgi:hypothetical protein
MTIAAWGWPQYTIVILWVISFLLHSAMNGDKLAGKYCAGCKLVEVAIIGFVLWAGGFWL